MKLIKVNSLQKVNPMRYSEGDVFLAEKSIGMIHNGKMDTLVKQSELKDYVKKKEVVKVVQDELKKVKAND